MSPQVNYCIFSIERHNYGAILELNYNFFEMLDINIEIPPENIISMLYPPVDKIVKELLQDSLDSYNKFQILEDCFKCIFNLHLLLLDIDSNLLPIR